MFKLARTAISAQVLTFKRIEHGLLLKCNYPSSIVEFTTLITTMDARNEWIDIFCYLLIGVIEMGIGERRQCDRKEL